ncbi:hypothetical protein, partial [Azonexus sp.]|uniref:hypothetical protein n=1 Tax=Azonexus sp. TaxID=1872668 RepID=UPI0039E310F3
KLLSASLNTEPLCSAFFLGGKCDCPGAPFRASFAGSVAWYGGFAADGLLKSLAGAIICMLIACEEFSAY